MKQEKNPQVTPHVIDGYLIISLEPKWLKVFDGVPKFVVNIDSDNKLTLRTIQSIPTSFCKKC